jgi:hypothetical protein
MKQNAARAIGFSLFFLMLVVPTVYRPIKGVLLSILLCIVVTRMLIRGRINLHPEVLLGTFLYVAVGLVFVLRGLLLGAPGALRMSTVYVLWPAVYTLLMAGVADGDVFKGLSRVLTAALFAICLYSLSYILWSAGWLPDVLYLHLNQGQDISFRNGIVEFNLYSIASLLFLVPYLIAALVTWSSADGPIPRGLLWIGVLLGLLVTLLSGRRGLMLVVSLAPFLAVAGRSLLPGAQEVPRRRRPVRTLVATLGVLGVTFALLRTLQGFNLTALAAEFTAGFEFGSDPVAISRASQFTELVDAWLDAPLLGAGYGATIPDLLRSQEMPWAFELSYFALLFNTGVVGMMIYGLGIGWTFVTGLRIVASGHSLGRLVMPVLVGTACFLIANATNPYLAKFDYEWVVFLPLAFANTWLLDLSNGGASTESASR